MDKQPGFDRLTFRNNVLRKDGNLPVNAMDIITVGFGVYGDFHTIRTVDISHNTFIISASQRENWSFNVIDLMAYPQVINWNDNVLLRFVEAKGAVPSGIVFVSQIDPIDERTIINIGPNNYLSGQEPLTTQSNRNGKATVNGWDKLHLLQAMSREQLETMLGINLHDANAADFGRFNAQTNAWYREHSAGASYEPGKNMMPVPAPVPAPVSAAATAAK